MTRRDWWLGIVLIVAAILVHALVPRYDWGQNRIRIDRWTGAAEIGRFNSGEWVSDAAIERARRRSAEAHAAIVREGQRLIAISREKAREREKLEATASPKIVGFEPSTRTPPPTGQYRLEDIEPPEVREQNTPDNFAEFAQQFGGVVETPTPAIGDDLKIVDFEPLVPSR